MILYAHIAQSWLGEEKQPGATSELGLPSWPTWNWPSWTKTQMGLPVQEPAGTVRPLRKVLPAAISSCLSVDAQGRQSPLASVSPHVMNEIALPWMQPQW